MQISKNYNLELPEADDNVDIDIISNDFKKIDEAIKENSDSIKECLRKDWGTLPNYTTIDTWTMLTNRKQWRSSIIGARNGWLYIIGGREDSNDSQKVSRYNLLKNIWEESPDASEKLESPYLTIHNDIIYCIKDTVSNTTYKLYRFDTINNKWLSPLSIPENIDPHGMVTFGDKIYIFCSVGIPSKNVIYYLDTKSNAFTKVEKDSLFYFGRNIKIAVIHNKIYLFNVESGSQGEFSYICYNPKNGVLSKEIISNKYNGFSPMAIEVIYNEVYFIGTILGSSSYSNDLRVLDLDTKEIIKKKSTIPISKLSSYPASTVIDDKIYFYDTYEGSVCEYVAYDFDDISQKIDVTIVKGDNISNNNYIGQEAQLTYNTHSKTIHVHDGSVAGGYALATEGAVRAVNNDISILKKENADMLLELAIKDLELASIKTDIGDLMLEIAVGGMK